MTAGTAPAGTTWCDDDWTVDGDRMFVSEKTWEVAGIELSVYGVQHRDGSITDSEVLMYNARTAVVARHIQPLTTAETRQLGSALREAANVAEALGAAHV